MSHTFKVYYGDSYAFLFKISTSGTLVRGSPIKHVKTGAFQIRSFPPLYKEVCKGNLLQRQQLPKTQAFKNFFVKDLRRRLIMKYLQLQRQYVFLLFQPTTMSIRLTVDEYRYMYFPALYSYLSHILGMKAN